ncbi:BolA-like protein [Glarea lozoyensis ATCC 20868]|uniref:BolA-like protein n=1 Tax=Glarea lozoyensis (strain ATCC 20868 / MF5171) TaxID=1116229 RepID=S3D769_GLAL2|nr:BolA-like protein [Glarea lozoyensis ATCC 20868]EPE32994.1 BolA-like protein [Glarea lozoyensis ATCC 20868]
MTPPALRHCLRTSPSRILRCQATAQPKCLAASICPARRGLTSISPLPSSNRIHSSKGQQGIKATGIDRERGTIRDGAMGKERVFGRGYSTKEGTIGSGEEGVGGSKMEEAPGHLNAKEKEIWGLLMRELGASELKVADVSGGCGSMYSIDITSEKFRGLSMLKQQRLVNQVLGEEIKGWHGVQLRTKAPA